MSLGGPINCLINELPVEWLESPVTSDLNFIGGESPNKSNHIAIRQRLGSFELYANLGDVQAELALCKLYSKMFTDIYPNVALVSKRARAAMALAEQGEDLDLLCEKYMTKPKLALLTKKVVFA